MHAGSWLGVAAALLVAAPVAAQEDAAPQPPAGVAASYVTPPRDADGYQTPNRALSRNERTWHLRVALNVAALGCRGAHGDATAAAYNAVLVADQAPLAEAMAALESDGRARHGGGWQARWDDDMTRLYNFFAQPPAHDGFCAAAESVLRDVATIPPGDLPGFAAAALPRLEAPFLAFFAACDAYRDALAAWRAQHPTVVIAAAAAAPVAGPIATRP